MNVDLGLLLISKKNQKGERGIKKGTDVTGIWDDEGSQVSRWLKGMERVTKQRKIQCRNHIKTQTWIVRAHTENPHGKADSECPSGWITDFPRTTHSFRVFLVYYALLHLKGKVTWHVAIIANSSISVLYVCFRNVSNLTGIHSCWEETDKEVRSNFVL